MLKCANNYSLLDFGFGRYCYAVYSFYAEGFVPTMCGMSTMQMFLHQKFQPFQPANSSNLDIVHVLRGATDAPQLICWHQQQIQL